MERNLETYYKEEKYNNSPKMKLNVNLKRVDLLITRGTDLINIILDEESSFPIMNYDTIMKIECQKGYGEEYCEKVLGVKPNIIDVR